MITSDQYYQYLPAKLAAISTPSEARTISTIEIKFKTKNKMDKKFRSRDRIEIKSRSEVIRTLAKQDYQY